MTVWGWTDDAAIRPRLVQYMAGVLRELGYRVGVRLVPHAFLDPTPKRLLGTIQLIPAGWGDTTNGFFATWFSCGGVNSHGWFCDPRIRVGRIHLIDAKERVARVPVHACEARRAGITEGRVVPDHEVGPPATEWGDVRRYRTFPQGRSRILFQALSPTSIRSR